MIGIWVILIGAAIMGFIVMCVEREDFPGWGKMALVYVGTMAPNYILDVLLPKELFFIGAIVGSICGGFLLMATCGMTVKKAAIAMGIFFAFRLCATCGIYYLSKQ